MSDNLIYHGSNAEVTTPKIIENGNYKDFGFGFYCTNLENQARKWAETRKGKSILNVYKFKQLNNLQKLEFDEMTDEWLEFVVNCRRGIKHDFDIVEGPMADDQIWDYVEDYIEGNISKEAFWVLVKFKYPTHQIVFCTENALQALEYVESIKI